MEDTERGYSTSNKFVCAECVGDDFISRLVEAERNKKCCDFCNEEKLCISVNIMMERFMDFVHFFYEDAAESSPVDHGEYVYPTTDMYDMIDENLDVANDKLFDHMKELFDSDSIFCEKIENYGDISSQHLSWTWQAFSNQLKHKMRFFFWKENEAKYDNKALPYSILYDIARNVEAFGFIKKVPKDMALYRAREDGEYKRVPKELGAPPYEIAPNNRMSPAGISFFYGSGDSATCQAEALNDAKKEYVIGEWKTCQEMFFLDLSKYLEESGSYKLPEVSIFDTKNLSKMPLCNFFAGFLEDVNKKILRDDIVAMYEYVPTQVIAEFFHHIYRTDSDEKISGIIYPSSQSKSGLNYVIFCGPSGCESPSSYGDKQLVSLIRAHEPYARADREE